MQKDYIYRHEELRLKGFLSCDETIQEPRPAVLVVHDWSGRNEFACQKAEMLMKAGYIGFAVDMYGEGRTGQTVEEKMALMQPLMADRTLLRRRLKAAYDAVAAMPEVDSSRISAIGFCFGGLCVLDLARDGVALRGVVSFHGLLHKPESLPSKSISARILALHGYDDPMVKPDAVQAFCHEMTEAGVDWQVHQYGLTQHSFTNPESHDLALGTVYNEVAARRSMQAMQDFLHEVMA